MFCRAAAILSYGQQCLKQNRVFSQASQPYQEITWNKRCDDTTVAEWQLSETGSHECDFVFQMRCTWMCFAGLHLLFPCCLDLFLTAGFPFLFTFQQGLEPVRPWRQRGVGRDRKKLVALIQAREKI